MVLVADAVIAIDSAAAEASKICGPGMVPDQTNAAHPRAKGWSGGRSAIACCTIAGIEPAGEDALGKFADANAFINRRVMHPATQLLCHAQIEPRFFRLEVGGGHPAGAGLFR
jgi:hypothetical protein